jgi:hypothetical protein
VLLAPETPTIEKPKKIVKKPSEGMGEHQYENTENLKFRVR